jgi:hypothetical protein
MYTGIAGTLGALLSTYVSPDSFPVFPFDHIPRRQRRLNFFGVFNIGLMYLMPNGAIGSVKFILAHVCQITQFSRSKNFSRRAKFSKL